LEPAAVVELDQIVIARLVLVDVSGKGIKAGTGLCCSPVQWVGCSGRSIQTNS
jgi:hypothetical protein